MPILLEDDPHLSPLYLAGERVPAGAYRQVETHRVVRLDHEDHLPASLDGRVACYVRLAPSWRQPTELTSAA